MRVSHAVYNTWDLVVILSSGRLDRIPHLFGMGVAYEWYSAQKWHAVGISWDCACYTLVLQVEPYLDATRQIYKDLVK